ncbi:hypothetical protein [Natrononativus amylolyticus]|uniref:hypothetical protein n=1 Tax=Natrononativus amylolyticus TaxID=2963434 RepID=UPI0020CE23BD|nr:hypothetical protein [Natrononativus amylolyticus]
MLATLWKRYVAKRPDRYQAYVAFPSGREGPSAGSVHDRIDELERVFEGKLDVYARVSSLAVVTDRVPSEQFDVAAFESALDRIEGCYADTHSLARLEKWRTTDGRLVKSYVVVPVKPLFPRDETDRPDRVRPAAD